MESRKNMNNSGVKLNHRGVAVVWTAITAVMATAIFTLIPFASAQSEAIETVSYTVQPGDTLWSYASRVTPRGGDIYDTMDKIKQINHLESDNIAAGQSLLVPQE